MKNIKYLIIVFIMFFGINNILAFDNTIKVYDYAQLLNEKEEQEIKTKINKYVSTYNIDMVIVSVKYYNQNTLEEYMNLFYRQNNFGKGTNKDGILLVIDQKENNNIIGIKTYGNAITLYSSDEIDEMLNKINNEDSDYDKLIQFINYSNKYINSSYIKEYIKKENINWFLILIPSLVISIVISLIIYLKNIKNINIDNKNYHIKDNNLVINKLEDKFITTKTKKTKIKK